MDPKTLTAIVKERNLIAVDMQSKTLPEEYKSRYYSRETCLGLIKKDLTKQCIIQFSQNLSAKELKSWTKGIQKSVLSSKKMNNPNHASVMKKRLKEQLEQDGLKKYIKSVDPSRKLLQATLKTLAMETELEDRVELVALLNKQLKLMALEAFLLELSPKLLQQMIIDSELNIKTTSKPTIVHHLVEMKDYTPVPRKMPVKPKLPSRPIKKSKKPANEDKENRAPNRRTKLENIEIQFSSDDSEEFNRKSVVEHDCSIEEQDDADKHPIIVSDSDSFYDDTSSDPDFNQDERKKARRRRKHRSRHRSSKRRHHRSHKKRDDYADTEDDSKEKPRKRKHGKHSDDDEAEEKPQRKRTKSDEEEDKNAKAKNEKDGSEDKTKEKPSEEKSPNEEALKKTKPQDEEHKKSDSKIPKSGKRRTESSEEDNSPPKKIEKEKEKEKALEEVSKKPEKTKDLPETKTRPENLKKTPADLIDEAPVTKKDKGKEETVSKKPKHKEDSENTKKSEDDEVPKKLLKEDPKKDAGKTRPESIRKTVSSLDDSVEEEIMDKKKIEKEKSKIGMTPKDKENPKDKHKRDDSDDRTKKSKKKY
jgi:hypothetical protein